MSSNDPARPRTLALREPIVATTRKECFTIVTTILSDSDDEESDTSDSLSPTLSPSPTRATQLEEIRFSAKRQGVGLSNTTPTKRNRGKFDYLQDDDDYDGDGVLLSTKRDPNIRYESTKFGLNTPVILIDDSDDSSEIEDYNNNDPVSIKRVWSKKHNHKLIPRIASTVPSKKKILINTVTVQLCDCVEFKDGTFMNVQHMIGNGYDGYILTGAMFVRADTLGPVTPSRRDGMVWKLSDKGTELDARIPSYFRGKKVLNEVVQKVRTVIGEDPDDYGLWRRLASEVVRTRQLRMTNQKFEENNCITLGNRSLFRSQYEAERRGLLTCRWRDTVVHENDGKWKAASLERPPRSALHPNLTHHESYLQKEWQGEVKLLQSADPIEYVDGFCGAGGMSAGASQAGLTITMAFDCDPNKILTHQMNFPDCRNLVLEVAAFIERAQEEGWRCTVLHLSPPCQPYSPINVRPNEAKNELGTTCLLACADVIKALRPRIVTIEQTPGIVSRHHAWFCVLLHQFTELGFVMRWSELKASEFGVPQLRRRLIVIGAAPGEVLPPFPKPTHTTGSVTIGSVLEDLEANHKDFPLSYHEKIKSNFTPRPPYASDCLAKTITCGGGENYHPSGKRFFTPRELASLQTFGHYHQFTPLISIDGGMTMKPIGLTELRTQIGNAVPPNLGMAVNLEIAKSLRESDRIRREEQHRDNRVIVLD